MTESPSGNITPLPGQPAKQRVEQLVGDFTTQQMPGAVGHIKQLIDLWPPEWKTQARASHSAATQSAQNDLSAAHAKVAVEDAAHQRAQQDADEKEANLHRAVEELRGDPDTPLRRGAYQDRTGSYRRGWGDGLHLGTLVLAVLADIAAFYQVIALAVGQQPWLLWFLVLAATALSLFLMHLSGLTIREVMAGQRGTKSWLAGLSSTGWAALGGGAFSLRLVVDDEAIGATPIFDFDIALGPLSQDSSNTNLTNALLFLALYLVTGLVAFVGAFVTKNPLKEACRKAEKELSEARTEVKTAYARLATAQEREQEAQHRIDALANTLEQQDDHFDHVADQLKVYAEIEAMKRLTR